MSAGAIIAIVVAGVVILAILAIAMPRARERSRIRRTQQEHRDAAVTQREQAGEHARRAELAGAQARRAEADAQIAEVEAQRHEAVAEADPADLRGRENEELRTGLDQERVRSGAER
jgi:FtsZ-interacting cell division protein ZipA